VKRVAEALRHYEAGVDRSELSALCVEAFGPG